MLGVKGSLLGMLATVGVLASGSAFAADPSTTAAAAPAKAKPAAAAKPKAAKAGSADEVAVLDTSKGRMVLEFWDKDAPKTVANFKALAKSGFYNGTGFHRIMKNFMIQGGDPKSKNPKAPDLGTGGSGKTVPDEFNSHAHVKGVISMASSGPNTAESQFFIVHGNASFLDGKYTAFGHVIKGMDVVDAIANVPVGPNPMMRGEPSKPLEWVTLKSVTIVPRSAAMGGKTTAAAPVAKSPKAEAAAAPPTPAAQHQAAEAKEDAAKANAHAADEAKEHAADAAKADTTKK
jgi:peptidyl-prolyl cis-trans isomerase B (cyclophilin B)